MTIYKLENNVNTKIVGDIDSSTTNIIIKKATSPYNDPIHPDTGEVGTMTLIDDHSVPTKIEIVYFTGYTDNGDDTLTLTGVQRGEENTTPKSFVSGSVATQTLTRDAINSLIDGISYSITADVSLGGISSGESISGNSLQDFLEQLLTVYDVPTINLVSSVSGGTREYGDNIASIDLTATPTKGDNDITLLNISTSRDGIVAEQTPVDSNGSSLSYNNLVSDYGIINDDITVTATVGDGTSTDTDSIGYSFVYPFYIGWVNENSDVFDGITRSELLDLNDVSIIIKEKSNTTDTTSPTNGRFIIGYLSSYGYLSEIIDDTGFDTISDYDIYEYDVEGLDGTLQNYRFYILKNDTTQTDFTNQYRF